MTRWQYQAVKIDSEGWFGGIANTHKINELLNHYGAEGWELVSSFDTNVGSGTTREIVFVLKRPYA